MTEKLKAIAAKAWRKAREGAKAVVAFATPLALAIADDVINEADAYLQLEYSTAAWIGVASAALVWLKRNLPASA